MILELKNQHLHVSMNTAGAEIMSIKKITTMNESTTETEYLWQGDPTYWGRRSPILFPIVGRLNHDTYQVDGQTYTMNQHGFARDCEFDVVMQLEDRISFRLAYDENTLAIYPYKFELYVHYALEASSLWIAYEVKNADHQPIYFSIGAHPGFICPLDPKESISDYQFIFNQTETAAIYPITKQGTLNPHAEPFLEHTNTLDLSPALFANDALVFSKLASSAVTLRSKKSSHQVTLDFEGFPYLGLWSKPSGAPFVCLEPWFGHADFDRPTETNPRELKDKEGILCLKEAGIFTCHYTLTF
jgi:galactose mutarotase-like enzyme